MRLAALATLALLVTAGSANATTFEVASGASGDCSVGDPCGTIGAAVTAARADTGGPHEIEVGPGTFAEAISLGNPNDTGLTISGAGRGSNPATSTILAFELTGAIGQAAYIGAPDITLQQMHFDTTPVDIGAGETRGVGILAGFGADHPTIRDVFVEMGPTTAPNTDSGIYINTGTRALVERATVRMSGEATGLLSQAEGATGAPDLIVRDSDIYGPSGGVAINAGASTNVIERSAIGADPDAERTLELNGTATVSSSLITGGVVGAVVFGNVSLRGVTIDRGETGVVDEKVDLGEGLTGAAIAAQSGTHVFDSSIAVEEVETFATLTCTNSNFTATAESGPGCPSGPSRPQGNFASPLSALFFDAANDDYDLPASSPARDSGRAGLGPGESITDILGDPRISGPRHDQGAYEFQVAAGAPRQPSLPGPLDTTAPTVAGARFSPARFAVGKRSTARSAARVKRGTTLSVRLSEPATVRVEIRKAAAGRRSKGKCRKPTRKRRKARKCTRYVKVKGAVLTRRNLPAGLNKIKFTGRIGRKALKPGRYRALITATDARANRSKVTRPKFRVVKAKR